MTTPIARNPIYRKRHVDADIIELCVRWYVTYRLSYRDLAETTVERGVEVTHSTILGWVARYVPEFEKRWNRFSKPVDTSWHNVVVPTNRYVNNVIEQDHRAIKRRCASMAGFKSFSNAAITIAGIELAHSIRKRQFSFGRGRQAPAMSLKQLRDRALILGTI